MTNTVRFSSAASMEQFKFSHVVVAALLLRLALITLLSVMRLHDLFAQLLLSLVYISVEFVPVFSDGELLVVVDRDMDFSRTDRLILRVMELSNVRMFKSLFSTQAF